MIRKRPKPMRCGVFLLAALTLVSCARSGSNVDVRASSAAALTSATHDAEVAFIDIFSHRCSSAIGFVPGSEVFNDGELNYADEIVRDMLPKSEQPVVVVGFGDRSRTCGEAGAKRRLALNRASFVTHRREAMGIRVDEPIAIGGPSELLESYATSAEVFFKCGVGIVRTL